jgi:hypothetical protein
MILNHLKKSESYDMDGIVIYAYNSKFDYVNMAEIAAKQAKKYLNLPVTLITDSQVTSTIFDSVIIEPLTIESTVRSFPLPNGESIESKWHNTNRMSVYDLSPYEKTLLIDADYLMFNDSLKHIFNTNSEFACFSEINDLAEEKVNQIEFRLSEITIPMYWATVVYFTKNEFAKSVFDFMQYIRDNWDYYSNLYNFSPDLYRNDFTLSIALQTLSGYGINNFNRLPGKLQTLFSNVDIIKDGDKIIFSKNGAKNFISGINLHIINKQFFSTFNE